MLKKYLLVLITLMLVGGLALVSCQKKCGCGCDLTSCSSLCINEKGSLKGDRCEYQCVAEW